MDLTKLITLYPNAQKKNSPASDKGILSLAIDDYFLWIDQSTISTQETHILILKFLKKVLIISPPFFII